jgi:hypothetical protein
MVQLGGLEPPTSGSTDQRSNQLSYSCTGRPAGPGEAETKCRPGIWQVAIWPCFSAFGALRDRKKQKPGHDPGFIAFGRAERPLNYRQLDLPKELLKPSFIGSAVSEQTFCACS